MFFLDEGAIFYPNDSFKKQLRELDVVPDADYLVDNDRVFVFDALVDRVRELSSKSPPNKSLKEIALTALPLSWMSASEAVSKWKVVPIPYKKVEAEGYKAILHQPFNALLPSRYVNDCDRDRDLASLLGGQTLSGEGDFVFAGQAMSLRQSLDPNLLPLRPVLRDIQELPNSEYKTHFSNLSRLTYESGFSPLSKKWFDRIKVLDEEWAAFNARIEPLVYSNIQLIWNQTEEIDWTRWNDTVTEEEAVEDLRQLRQCYPELKLIRDGSLYGLFDSYQMDYLFTGGWSASRDENFFFYLLGCLANPPERDGFGEIEIGTFVGYELLRTQSLHGAIESGKIWFAYDRAIEKLARHVREIVEFLSDRPDLKKKGNPIVTQGDWFAFGRKPGASLITSQQSLENLH